MHLALVVLWHVHKPSSEVKKITSILPNTVGPSNRLLIHVVRYLPLLERCQSVCLEGDWGGAFTLGHC